MMVILRGSKELLTKYKEDNKILALIEDLIFEILYPKLFNTDEDLIAKSIEIQEKLLVLQNMITPDLLEIPKQCRLPSFLLHLQNGCFILLHIYNFLVLELKKINERKSPLNKLKVISNCFDNMISNFPEIIILNF